MKLQDPQFEGQTKTKLGTRGCAASLRASFRAAGFFLEENPKYARAIVEKCTRPNARAMRRRKSPSLLLKEGVEGSGLPGKLVDRKNGNAAECELFLVKGDSVGATLKAAAIPKSSHPPVMREDHQLEKARLDKVLANEEIVRYHGAGPFSATSPMSRSCATTTSSS